MFNRMIAATVLTLGLALPLHAQNTLLEVPITKDFVEGELGSDQGRGKLFLAYQVLDIRGVSLLCGASRGSNGYVSSNTVQILRKGWLKANGKKILTDLTFFNKVPRQQTFEGAKARCKPLPIKGNGKVDLEIGFDPIRLNL